MTTMTREDVLNVVAKWTDAFAKRDLKAYAELYSDKAVLESPLAGSVCGREAVTKTVLAQLSAFPDAQFDAEQAMVDGHHAAIVATTHGTHVGTFLGIPPTGRPFRFTLVFLLEFDEAGHITKDRRIYDFTGFLVQLGVLKAKPA